MICKLSNTTWAGGVDFYYDQIMIFGMEFWVCSTTETLSTDEECIYRMYCCKNWTLKDTLEAYSQTAKFYIDLRKKRDENK